MADDNGRPAGAVAKPVIFISYSHKDEPDKPRGDEVQWLSFVRTYLQPAIKFGIVDLFVDENLHGGDDLKLEIEKKLRGCDIFILLISAHSMASNYIVDTEIRIIRERQANGEDVHFYPLLLTPTPKVALDKLKNKVIRPRDAQPLSSFKYDERIQQMTDVADEIATIATEVANRKPKPRARGPQPGFVHITGLPETPYERLVGRDAELKRLDDAWADRNVNIISLIAEGGAGKSALVNEWLKRMQSDNYRGAESVLGWSFYSQGSKERATSAEEFLNWALDKLGITLATTSVAAKAEAIAEAMMRRRMLLLLDGVEPLQHGLDTQLGQLKDLGLRALLRRFAATPPGAAHGLIVLTSRLAVKDIARWQDGVAPVVDVERLSDEAGAALLRDNGVWGADKELKAAAHDFGGHPLALGLLASFLKQTQTGDVRRRDHIRGLLADIDNPGHDHARRVMESIEAEWLAGEPVLLAIMHIIGLFDRPVSGDCLQVLRETPVIHGFPDSFVDLSDGDWNRAITRLREIRLLAPVDSLVPETLDAHPLVREWFGERFRTTAYGGWRVAHARLYEHLRDTTDEGNKPTLKDLTPLYHAISHGCSAGWYEDALEQIYLDRICRRTGQQMVHYATRRLGAYGTNLAAISWFFEEVYKTPISALNEKARALVLSHAAISLRVQGRLSEALQAQRASVAMSEASKNKWSRAAAGTLDICETELLVGQIEAAVTSAERAIKYADSVSYKFRRGVSRALLAHALHLGGRRSKAEELFEDAEHRLQPSYPLLPSVWGFRYCDLLIDKLNLDAARARATKTLKDGAGRWNSLLSSALDRLSIGRTYHCLALLDVTAITTRSAHTQLIEASDGLRASGQNDHLPLGLLARAAFHRSVGDRERALRDLEEVEEIAEPGSMKLYLCDMALERARLAFAQIEAFAPLNGLLEKDNPPKPVVPDMAEIVRLKDEAAKQIKIAADYIESCGYHRRDEERDELQDVRDGKRKFAELPPRV